MKLDKVEPFIKYSCYLNLHKKMNRMQVCIINDDNKCRRTILYSKYLMSIKECRILSKEEEVDHIDGNKLNDNISNLEIVTRNINLIRSINRNYGMLTNFNCAVCGKSFTLSKSRSYLSKGQLNKYCSRSCAGQVSYFKKIKI